MRRVVLLSLALLMMAAAVGCAQGSLVRGVLPTPTFTPVRLPTRPAESSALAPAPTRVVQPSPTPAVQLSPTPTRVLWAPLPTEIPAVLATLLPARTPTPTSVPTGQATQPVSPRPAVSGRMVMQTSSGGPIVVVGPNGQATKLADGLDPAWSPDGTKIAFSRWAQPQAGIYIMNADGSDLRLLYEVNGAKSPTWSPDGTKIAFTWLYKQVRREPPRGAPAGFPVSVRDYWRITVVDAVSGKKLTDVPLDPDGHAFAPHWGPDGRIVYKGVRGLWLVEETGTPWQMTDNPLQTSPVWSPDGKKIAFMSEQHDHWDIGVINSDGSGLTYLTSTPFVMFTKPINNVAPAWTPDGRSITFLTDREGDWKIYIMDADGSNQRKLFDIPVAYDFAAERVMSWTESLR